jgi:hypothetical protein
MLIDDLNVTASVPATSTTNLKQLETT